MSELVEIEFKIIKDIPVEQIKRFENQTVINVATLTREMTKSKQAFPYLTGELERSEVASSILTLGSMEYGLAAGVDYAKYVWAMEDVNWTNKLTEPKWYLTTYRKSKDIITQNAVISAVRSVK